MYLTYFFFNWCRVALGTVSRMARRLERRSVSNREIAAKRSGILEPSTVHAQGLKLHFTDIDGKASLLYTHQMQAVSARANDQELGDQGRQDLRPGKHDPADFQNRVGKL